ncbi:hypothetical protein AB9P05_01355 [Roseivirga sp. BDSF3-8]|uniref:hypothetical protein n=1 Tax=Roseivirga sp. BDSF3-8 TaxID=3241598 RepID=UPI0035326617
MRISLLTFGSVSLSHEVIKHERRQYQLFCNFVVFSGKSLSLPVLELIDMK